MNINIKNEVIFFSEYRYERFLKSSLSFEWLHILSKIIRSKKYFLMKPLLSFIEKIHPYNIRVYLSQKIILNETTSFGYLKDASIYHPGVTTAVTELKQICDVT